MDAKHIRKEYIRALPALHNAMRKIKAKLASLPQQDFIIETNYKPYKSVQRKAEERGSNHLTDLSDLIRGRVFFSTNVSHKDALANLKSKLDDFVKSVDNKKQKDYGLEYRGIIHIDLSVDGVNFELQLIPIEFKHYKPFLHRVYELFRDKKKADKLSDKEKDLLRSTHNELHRNLDRIAHENRSQS